MVWKLLYEVFLIDCVGFLWVVCKLSFLFLMYVFCYCLLMLLLVFCILVLEFDERLGLICE